MATKGILLALAGLALGMAWCGEASAASPAYCALYAREYAVDIVQPAAAPGMLKSIENQAYYRCLNQDEDPQLPAPSATSAYFGTDLAPPPVPLITATDDTDPAAVPSASAPLSPSATANADVGIVASTAPAGADNSVTTKAASPAAYHGSGLMPWTPEWQAWCAKYFPKSWDPKTGTVVHASSTTKERVLCQ